MSWHYSRKLVELHSEYLQNLPKNVHTESPRTDVLRGGLSPEKQRGQEVGPKDWPAEQPSLQQEDQQARIPDDVCGESSICRGAENGPRACNDNGNFNRAQDQTNGMRSPSERNQDGQQTREFGDTNTCRTFATPQQAHCPESKKNLRPVCVNLRSSQALVAEYSAENCSDGAQSVPSSGSPIPQAFLSPDRMKAFSRLSRFGMTCKPLTENLGKKLLMLYLTSYPSNVVGRTTSDYVLFTMKKHHRLIFLAKQIGLNVFSVR